MVFLRGSDLFLKISWKILDALSPKVYHMEVLLTCECSISQICHYLKIRIHLYRWPNLALVYICDSLGEQYKEGTVRVL